jgi:heme exporter protein D
MDVNEFLSMGGYASYVWPAYGIAASVLIAMTVASVCRLLQIRRDLARLESDVAAKATGSPP